MSATATTEKKEKPAKTPKAEKPPKVVKEKESIETILARAEDELCKKYPHVVPGSIWNVGQSEEHGQKRTVEVICQYEGCNLKRRVATSDLHQAKYCPEHTRVTRLERRKDARAAKQAAKPPKPAKVPKAKAEKSAKAEKVAAAS